MQYEKAKATKIMLRSDWSTGGSSRQHGANLDSVGFNLEFIARRNPNLAIEIVRLSRRANQLKEADSLAPDEDYLLAEGELKRLMV